MRVETLGLKRPAGANLPQVEGGGSCPLERLGSGQAAVGAWRITRDQGQMCGGLPPLAEQSPGCAHARCHLPPEDTRWGGDARLCIPGQGPGPGGLVAHPQLLARCVPGQPRWRSLCHCRVLTNYMAAFVSSLLFHFLVSLLFLHFFIRENRTSWSPSCWFRSPGACSARARLGQPRPSGRQQKTAARPARLPGRAA